MGLFMSQRDMWEPVEVDWSAYPSGIEASDDEFVRAIEAGREAERLQTTG